MVVKRRREPLIIGSMNFSRAIRAAFEVLRDLAGDASSFLRLSLRSRTAVLRKNHVCPEKPGFSGRGPEGRQRPAHSIDN